MAMKFTKIQQSALASPGVQAPAKEGTACDECIHPERGMAVCMPDNSACLRIVIVATSSQNRASNDEVLIVECGHQVDAVVGSAILRHRDGREENISGRISWIWGGKARGQGDRLPDAATISRQFSGSRSRVTVVARVDKADARGLMAKARVMIESSCVLPSMTEDQRLLARLIYAEAGHVVPDERAAVGWTVVNRRNRVAKNERDAMVNFGDLATLHSVISHRANGVAQYQSFHDKNSQWDAIERPESLNCLDCAALRECILVAKGVLDGSVGDPYAKDGGAFYMHLNKDGVAKGERQYSIVRLKKRSGFVHHFWTYDPR